jgi:hypothetical protein
MDSVVETVFEIDLVPLGNGNAIGDDNHRVAFKAGWGPRCEAAF